MSNLMISDLSDSSLGEAIELSRNEQEIIVGGGWLAVGRFVLLLIIDLL